MKATAVLHEQHRHVEKLVKRIEQATDLRIPLLLELVEELMAHVAIEDHLYYCWLSDALDLDLATYRDDHTRLKNALLQLVFSESDAASFEHRLGDLTRALTTHVAFVDRNLAPTVEQRMPARELEELGERMASFYEAAVTPELERDAAPASDVKPTGTEDA
jgi:hypothetical protein